MFSRILIISSAILLCAHSLFAKNEIFYDIGGDSIVVSAPREMTIPEFSSIGTKMNIPIQEIPLSVGVINQSLIENQNNFVLGDALKNISGIHTQTGFGVHDYFVIRGLNSLDNGLILTDGTLEPEVTYYNLYNVDQIEVLKGPGAFLYGSNPLSGTVNLVRKQPVFKNFINLHSTFGQFNTIRQSIDMGMNHINNKLASRINVLWENADNYRNDKENKIWAVNPSLLFYVNPTLAIHLNAEFINSQYKPDSGLPLVYNFITQQLDVIPDVDRKTSYQAPFDASDQKIVRIKMNVDKVINSNLKFQSKVYYSHLDWESNGTLLNGAYPIQTGDMLVNRSGSFLTDDRKVIGNQNEIQWSFETGSIKHQILTGFEWNVLKETYQYDMVPALPALDLFNPVETAVQNQLMIYPYLKGDVTNTVIAPYAIDRISISDDLQITAGVRYDKITFENTAVGYETDRDYNHVSPMAGVHYAPVSQIALYANSGQAYASPSSQVVGEQDAETSNQYEVGIKQVYFDGKLNLDIAWYNLTKENIAMPASDGISKTLGSLESKGVEVELKAEPLPNLFTFVSYAYSDVELTQFNQNVAVGQNEYGQTIYMVFDRTGNRPAFTPKHLVNVWLTKELNQSIGVGGGMRSVASQFIDENNVFEIESTLVLDGMIYYHWNKAKFSLNFKNITDEVCWMRGFMASSIIPAAPRSIFAKIDLYL